MKYIGAHVSASGGLHKAPEHAAAIGAKAFALFTKNQRQWHAKPLTGEEIAEFKSAMDRFGFLPRHVLPHDSYLINLANPDSDKRQVSLDAFIEEMQRVEALGLDRLNFHPGAHMNASSIDDALRLVAEGMDRSIEETTGVYAVIETTAGQGSALGRSFEEIARIIEFARHDDRIGVCIDTCHIFAAGYDIRSRETFDRTMEDFGRLIGFDRLMGIHLNDAKSAFDSHVDRHHSLGLGNLGLDPFRFLMQDERFDEIPIILETIDPDIWADEIATLYRMAESQA